MLRIFLALTFFSCTAKHPAESSSPQRLKALVEKKAFYCAEGRKILAEKGYMDERCDSLLFTSLWSVACEKVDLSSWEESPGKWHRNPARDCFLNGEPNGSASTISKDMLLGLMAHLWKYQDQENIQELYAYGKENNWIMGEAKDNETLLSRCLLSLDLISLLSKMAGKGSREQLVATGYEAHLAVLRVVLSGKVDGAISDINLWTLEEQTKRQPMNALFKAAASRYGKADANEAVAILLDSPHFPTRRLPTSMDHCTSYLFSRDQESSDWDPCPEKNLKYDGTDFVFAASLLDGTF